MALLYREYQSEVLEPIDGGNCQVYPTCLAKVLVSAVG
jgi:hypothetical protein